MRFCPSILLFLGLLVLAITLASLVGCGKPRTPDVAPPPQIETATHFERLGSGIDRIEQQAKRGREALQK
jgi:hypothetical protein